MKTKLFSTILFACLLLFAVNGWGATYYATVGGTVTAANKANATSCAAAGTSLNLAQVNAATILPDDIVDLCGETYTSGTLTPHDSGTSGHQITYQDGTFTAVGGNAIYINGKNYITIRKCKTSGGMVYVKGSLGAEINYNEITNCSNNWGVYIDGTSTAKVQNNLIASNYKGGIYTVTPAVSTVTNNIIIANGTDYGGYGAFRSTGTTNADYNIVTGNGQYQNWNFTATGVTDGGHNQKQVLPKTVSPKVNKALFSLTSDDHDVAYWQALDTALTPYSVKFTMFVQTGSITAGEYASLATLAAAGHDLGMHSWSHTLLTSTDAFSITTTNADATINVDTATKVLTLFTSTAGNTVTLTDIDTKTAADLVNAVVGKGWTIILAVQSLWHLVGLNDTSGAQAIGAGYTATINTTAFWTDELITYGKTWMTTNLGITPTVMSQAGGFTSAGIETFIKDTVGFVGSRGAGPAIDYYKSTDIFHTGCYQMYASAFTASTSEADTRATARGVYTHAIENGVPVILLAHTATEFSVNQVTWFVDEIQKAGGTWVLFKDLIADIKSDHATADDITYTKTYTDVSDYTLQSTSPAINAGTDLCATLVTATDMAGNPVCTAGVYVGKGSAPEIGAYEYIPTSGGDGGGFISSSGFNINFPFPFRRD